MPERVSEGPSEGLLNGLSHEPQIVKAAEWLINGVPLKDGYLVEYDDLVRNMQQLYGIDKETINGALKVAEERVLRSTVDG